MGGGLFYLAGIGRGQSAFLYIFVNVLDVHRDRAGGRLVWVLVMVNGLTRTHGVTDILRMAIWIVWLEDVSSSRSDDGDHLHGHRSSIFLSLSVDRSAFLSASNGMAGDANRLLVHASSQQALDGDCSPHGQCR